MAEAAAPPPFDADAYVEQASRLVGTEVAAAFRPGVAANIALIARMADLVMGLPLAHRGRAGAGVRAGRARAMIDPWTSGVADRGADPQRARCRPWRWPRRRWPGSRPGRAAQQLHHGHRRARPGRGRRRRCGACAWRRPAAAGRRALCGQEPVRPRGRDHRRRLEDRARQATRRRRCVPGRADARRRCGLRRCAQHGRIRLRLHHRERALRPLPQPARPRAVGRRLVRRLRCRRRRRPGAAVAWAATPTARSGCRPACAASSA